MAKPKTEVVTVRIPVPIMNRVRKTAEKEMRYYTQQINEILKDWAKKEDVENIQNSVQHQQVSIDGAD